MKLRYVGRAAAVCVAAGVAGVLPATVANGKSNDWSLDLSAGVKFDDRVTVDEADASAASDVAVVLELDAAYKVVNESDARVEIGYEFYQSIYSDLSAFNWQEHNPSISAWKKFGGMKLGIAYDYTNARLDGSFYYAQHALTPSLSTYLSDDMQLILSYKYYDKDYTTFDDNRDAVGHQPNADLYVYFSEDKKGYVTFGAGYTDEDTSGPEYDYSGFVGRAAVQFPIEPFGLPGRIRLSYSYQMRDYDNPESLFPLLPPVPGDPTREDDRQTLRAFAEVEVAEDLKLFTDYRFQDRGSNLDSADYNKNVVSVGLEYGF
jgi:Surface lipoprotein assembly modifier